MGAKKLQPRSGAIWALARRQHWVVTRAQLMELGLGSKAIRHRLWIGRLHPVMRGVYAVGRAEIDSRGRWMAAILACGPHALLSHHSAAALLRIRKERPGPVDVVIPDHVVRSRPGIRVHRQAGLGSPSSWSERWPASETVDRIPVTGPVPTLVDLAMCLPPAELEAAVNEASQRDLIDPESLREALDAIPPRPGVARLRRLLDRHTFVLTETRLEQLFLPIARTVGLSLPQTQVWLGGYRVDFYWPDLGLVVEADSLRYHRTPAKQAADNRRDQAHIAAGRMPLHFTHWQVRYEPDHVSRMLTIAARQREGVAEDF
jgi:very-short-patch-repair endonuclease